jgi:hypothetical protein
MSPDASPLWAHHPVPREGDLALRIGPLELTGQRRGDELRLRWWRVGEPRPKPRTWTRWATPESWDGSIWLSPALPDRLVVVEPDVEFRLVQGARARLYVRVPLSLQVSIEAKARTPLLQLPTVVMSDTWWGSLEEGELGYALPTFGRRQLSDVDYEDHLCICTLQLENRSTEDLRVDKIALRTRHLSLYADGPRIWSDVTRVRYLGDDTGSRIRIVSGAPDEAGAAKLATPSRERPERSFTARTFARLRSTLGGRG